MKKAKIIRYYQIVDENGIVIDNTHTLKDAVITRDRYNDKLI